MPQKSERQRVGPVLLQDAHKKHEPTILSIAAGRGDLASVELLLSQDDIDVNHIDADNLTSLHFACAEGHIEVVRRFLAEDGIRHDIRDRAGNTPLLNAAAGGHTEVVRLLLACGLPEGKTTNARTMNNVGQTPLRWAAAHGSVEMARLLLEHDSSIDPNAGLEYGQAPLVWAAHNGSIEMVSLLLSFKEIDVNARDESGNTALLSATGESVELVQLLLSHSNIDPNIADDLGETPLSSAVAYGQLDLVLLLLSHPRINVEAKDKTGFTAFSHAVAKSSLSIVEHLASHGVDLNTIDNRGRTPLILAAKRAEKDIFSALLSENVDLDVQDHDGRTALSYATEEESEDIVSTLLSLGVDPNVVGNDGRSPLLWATESRNANLISNLLARDADPNFKDKNGRSPLSWAAGLAQRDTVLILLSHGAYPDSQDNDGLTPLLIACKGGFVDIMLILLIYGADYNIKGADGETLRSYSSTRRSDKIVDLLEADGIDRNGLGLAILNPEVLSYQLIQEMLAHDFKDKNGRTLLSRTAEVGNRDLVKQILSYYALDPTIGDNRGRSPLHWAAEKGHEDIVFLLLGTKKFDPDARDDLNHTALALAVANNHQATIKALVTADTTTLHLMLEQNNRIGVGILLGSGYNVNMRDQHGQTPLYLAVKNANYEMATQLVLNQASINAEDYIEHQTPLQLAIRQQHEPLIALLLKHSASAKKIMAREWLHAYKRHSTDIVQLSNGGQKVDFFSVAELSPRYPVINGSGREKRLIIITEYSSWKQSLSLNPPLLQHFSSSERALGLGVMTYIVLLLPKNGYDNKQQDIFTVSWEQCGLAWSMMPSSNAKNGSSWSSIDHFSMLPYGWIPEDSLDFIRLSIFHLKDMWFNTCDRAEKHQAQRRIDQLVHRGGSATLINGLASDAAQWTLLRNILRNQVESVKSFAWDYSRRYSEGSNNLAVVQEDLDLLSKEVNDKMDGLDQTGRDLLQLEFAWVSINELHGMRRITWISFIFLPLMFASSLFGMNVDILKDNPNWRWYILVGGTFVALTFLTWLMLKYSAVEPWVGKKVDQSVFWVQQSTQLLPGFRPGVVSPRWNLPREGLPTTELAISDQVHNENRRGRSNAAVFQL